MSMKIHNNHAGNIFADIAFIAADFAGVAVEEVIIDAETKATKEYMAKNPTGKFPLLECEKGTLWESGAVARHIASHKEGLNGANNWESSQVDQWTSFTKASLMPHMMPVLMSIFGHKQVEADKFNQAVKDVKEAAKVLNAALEGKDWLVGNHMTVADIIVGSSLVLAYQTILDAGFRKAMPNAAAFMTRFLALPEVIKRFGIAKMCGKALKPASAAAAAPAKAAPAKAAAPKKEAAAEKKEEAPKDDDEMDLFGDEDDDEEAEAAKEAIRAAKAAAHEKTKKVVIAKSLILFDVKPWDETIDLDAVAAKILSEIVMDGLVWKTEFKKEPVAYGVCKLCIGCVIEDDKISTDDLTEQIVEKYEDFVQSCDVAVFSKI